MDDKRNDGWKQVAIGGLAMLIGGIGWWITEWVDMKAMQAAIITTVEANHSPLPARIGHNHQNQSSIMPAYLPAHWKDGVIIALGTPIGDSCQYERDLLLRAAARAREAFDQDKPQEARRFINDVLRTLGY